MTNLEENPNLQQEFRQQNGVSKINDGVLDIDTNQDKVTLDASGNGPEKSADITLQPNEMDQEENTP